MLEKRDNITGGKPPALLTKNRDFYILKLEEERRFITFKVGSRDAHFDTEAKLFEYLADISEDGKEHAINLLSEKCMCESCLGVMRQFKERYPNVTINATSTKKTLNDKTKGKPWSFRKFGK